MGGRLSDQNRSRLMVQAAELAVAGHSRREIAEALGVAGSTLARWRERDEWHQHLVRLRKQIVDDAASSLGALIPLALKTIKEAIEAGDAKLAHQLLRDSGALSATGELHGMSAGRLGGTGRGGGPGGVQIQVNLVQKPNTYESERTVEADVVDG